MVDGITEYTYDALGQLLTEKRNGTVVNLMTYDNYGNIKSKNGITYTYGDAVWNDLLTKVGNMTISYDEQGNPTSYLGHTLTWEKGRQLKYLDNIQYAYNANGIRTTKVANGVWHSYTLDGTKILKETSDADVIIPMYDNEDSVCGISYNNVPYYFQKNLQGDIIAIVDKDAETVATYSYDAWGVPTVKSDTSECGIADINPFRYRGYYYDAEIGLYYLQSRYYDPVVGRFINADDATILTLANALTYVANAYIYCGNNAITGYDPYGFADAGTLVGYISIASLFSSYATALLTAFTSTLAKITAYVTAVLIPKAAAIFWWNPGVIVGIVAAAVAIVIGAIIIYNNANDNKTVEQILKTKKGSIKNAPLPPGGPNWNDILKKTLREIKESARKNIKGYKEIYKLLTDSRFNR